MLMLSNACGDAGESSTPNDEANGGGGSAANAAGSGGTNDMNGGSPGVGGQNTFAGRSTGNAGGRAGHGGNGGSGVGAGGDGMGGSGGRAAGGSGGQGMTQTLPPLPCDKLPGAGNWENISPQGLSDTTALIEDPFEAGTVWLGTTNGGLHKSTDCGATFTHVSTGRGADEFNTKGQGQLSMAVDPIDKGVIYVFKYGGHGVLKSTNGGVDWDQTIAADSEVAKAIPSRYIDSISMDPSDHKHLVTSNHVNCNAPYNPTCMAETTDGGATWRVFKSAPGTGWEEGGGVFVINSSTFVYAGLHLYVTTDKGQTFKLLDPDPAPYWGFNIGEVETHSIPRGPDGTYYLPAGQGVVKSTDGGLTWSLIPNSGGRKVGFVMTDHYMYAIDQWNPSLHGAALSDPSKWTAMKAPPIPNGQGCPYLDYDKTHHILYASCYGAGAWRMVMQ
jgi:hypothetical protein